MTVAVPTVDELRTRVTQMQGRPATQPVRTHPALAGLLHLQTGSTYGVESASLATMLLAGPSADGLWCGIVGSPGRDGTGIGLEAAAAAGVELSRTILVPDPGDAWLEVTAALIDVLGSGHGHLQARQATVEVRRGTAPPVSKRLWLPDTDLTIRSAEEQPVTLRSVS